MGISVSTLNHVFVWPLIKGHFKYTKMDFKEQSTTQHILHIPKWSGF